MFVGGRAQQNQKDLYEKEAGGSEPEKETGRWKRRAEGCGQHLEAGKDSGDRVFPKAPMKNEAWPLIFNIRSPELCKNTFVLG